MPIVTREHLSEQQRRVALIIGPQTLGMVKSLRINVILMGFIAEVRKLNKLFRDEVVACRPTSSGFGACIPQRGARSSSPPQRGAWRVEVGGEATQKGVLRWRHVSELDAS